MVSISLYRGNLHKVPNGPRNWLMPARKISLKNFKTLLRRRSRALSRITTTNPNPNSDDDNNNDTNGENWEGVEKNDCENKEEEIENEKAENDGNGIDNTAGLEKLVEATESLVVEVKRGAIEEAAEVNAVSVETKAKDVDTDNVARIDDQVKMKEEEVVVANPNLEIATKEEAVSDKQKRRQEIEEKLKILNERKHSLVQALKQIINAEEELKRRSNMQGVAGQPPVDGGQVEVTHDSGSMSRHNTPRMGSEGNGSGEAEGAEIDGAKNNVHLRHLVRMSSTSPSSDTQQHRSTFTPATLPSRTNSGVANSPSRFALAVQQGLPPNLPSVSVSGTNYVASSPSPAASGGTSAFRDARGPSPWN